MEEDRMAVADELVLGRKFWRPNVKEGSILFVGTATTLIQYAGFTILTDPNFLHAGDDVHLGYGLKSKRLTDPSLEIEDLPSLDLVILSHMHEDHFDRIAAERLDRNLPIVTTPEAAADLTELGFTAPKSLNTWETLTVKKGSVRVKITSMPGRHGGPIVSKALPAVMGSMLEWQRDDGSLLLRLYISGDTLMYRDLRKIPERYPEIDIAMLHLGGTRVLGVLVTMDGEQGVRAVKLLKPQVVIPIHYNDYTVFKSPLDDFKRRIHDEGLDDAVRYLSHGERYRFRLPIDRLG
jgi:L-ascorbate metabolism protein UlaG (beta-lactamase superfamily)